MISLLISLRTTCEVCYMISKELSCSLYVSVYASRGDGVVITMIIHNICARNKQYSAYSYRKH